MRCGDVLEEEAAEDRASLFLVLVEHHEFVKVDVGEVGVSHGRWGRHASRLWPVAGAASWVRSELDAGVKSRLAVWDVALMVNTTHPPAHAGP